MRERERKKERERERESPDIMQSSSVERISSVSKVEAEKEQVIKGRGSIDIFTYLYIIDHFQKKPKLFCP